MYKLIDCPRLRLREEGAFRGGSANMIIIIIITIHINLYNIIVQYNCEYY